jgi:hypothetical protein
VGSSVVSGSVVNVESWQQEGRFTAELRSLGLGLGQLQIGSGVRRSDESEGWQVLSRNELGNSLDSIW